MVSRFSKKSALAYLQSLNPVALYVPGMQADALREDGGETYLTRFTDFSGNGNHATQPIDASQAHRDGSDAVFSGGQCYEIPDSFVIKNADNSICARGRVDSSTGQYILSFPSNTNSLIYGYDGDRLEVFMNPRIGAPVDLFTYFNSVSVVAGGVKSHYLDNALAGSGAQTVGSATSNTIGCSSPGTNMFKGRLSSVAIYTHALTATERTIVNQALTVLGTLGIIEPPVFNIKVAAGLFDFSWNGPDRLWTFPDGSTSTDVRPTRTLDSDGVVTLTSEHGWGGNYVMNDGGTNTNFIGDLSNFPPIEGTLNLGGCVDMTGDILSSPPLTRFLALFGCPRITGKLDHLSPLSIYVSVAGCLLVHGVIPASVTAHQIYLAPSGMSQEDIEQSLINVNSVAAPVAPPGAIFDCATGMPTISDPTAIAAANSLRSKGWDVRVNGS